MTEKDMNLPASDEAVDAILAEVLGNEGSHMVRRYSGDGEAIPVSQAKEEPVAQQPQTPPVAAPKNTVPVPETSPEMIEADYRSAAAKYEVNGYRFSAPQAPAYAPYPAYPAYPAYPQPYGYVPYPAYPAYPAYPQPYGYAQYPTGYEGYAEYPSEQPQQPAPEQDNQSNPYAAAAGSRVVYDAAWAEPGRHAPQRTAQSQQPAVPVMHETESGKPHVNPAFIDPLSAYDDDETIPSPYTDTVSFADRHNAKNPQPQQKKQGTDFFPAGFSATKNNAVAANGKTTPVHHAATDSEAVFAGFSDDYEKTANRRQEWLMTDEEFLAAREQRRKNTADALSQATKDTENTIPSANADKFTQSDEEAQRKAEAQQIIAERFSQAAEQEIIYNSTQAFENDPVEDDITFADNAWSDPDYKGESELYYNNPKEPAAPENEQSKEKKKGNKFTAFIRRNTPHKGQTKRELISCLIMDLAFIVLIGGLIFCGIYLKNYKDTLDREKITIQLYEEGMEDKYTDVQLQEYWKDVKATYPDVDYPDGMNPDFAQLYAVNQDVAGWLTIDGVDLTTVILQADDNDYYLYRDLYKEQTKYGTPFVDYRNSMHSPTLSRNTIIYGHNTHDGLKFNNMIRYLQLSGYKAAPIVKLNTLFNGVTYWKIFAVTLSDSTTDEFEYLYTSFNSDTAFLNFVDDIRAHSMFDIDVDVAAGDNIITLYTCYQNLFEGGRLTVFARQVRAGEDLVVNTDNATVNSDCIYPNAYYGITYENATSEITGTTQPSVSDDNTTEALIPDASLPPEAEADATEESTDSAEEDIVFGEEDDVEGGETPQEEDGGEENGEESLG